MNAFRRLAFLIITLGEIAFALWAMTAPVGYNEYGYSLSLLLDFRVYLASMAIGSALAMTLYWIRRYLQIVTVIGIYLAVLWLSIAISPMLMNFYSISLPLYFLMFVLRIIMAIMTQAEGSEHANNS